jgi:RNA polymerase sigma-70 factor (ECF subfamily)
MSDDVLFADFIRRIRAGDAEAAGELVRRYEPVVRLEVRVRLSDPRLGRVLDSMDICQSVLASFFVRAAAGQYDLEQPQDLVKLLVVMARKKLAFQARKERAQRRDNRRVEAAAPEVVEAAAVGPSPSEEVAGRELLAAFRQRLSAEERQLADRRAQGQGWAEIAAALGGTAQARRKQLERAVQRVARQLGLEDESDDEPG